MPERDGDASTSDPDVAALVAQLREELGRAGPRHVAGARPSTARFHARAAADRVARVSADRHIGGREGVLGAVYKPVKVVVRKLVRWYVEPVFADQRAFNDAALKLLDDLHERVERLEAELRERDPARR